MRNASRQTTAGGSTCGVARTAAISVAATRRRRSTPATTPIDNRHPIVRSFEPDEDWFYDYVTEDYAEGLELAPPDAHPLDQPVPGPAGRVPPDWEDRLH